MLLGPKVDLVNNFSGYGSGLRFTLFEPFHCLPFDPLKSFVGEQGVKHSFLQKVQSFIKILLECLYIERDLIFSTTYGY